MTSQNKKSRKNNEEAPPIISLDQYIPFPKDEIGISELVLREQGNNLLWCEDDGCFYIWNSRQWEKDSRHFGKVYKLVKKVIRDLLVKASKIEDDGQREKAAKFAASSQKKKMIDAVHDLIKPEVKIKITSFDADPWLFNVENGTIDLRTGKLLPHNREHHITKIGTITYDANAVAPMWNEFLAKIFASDDLIQFVQRAVGYTMAGVVQEKKSFFIAHGIKDTGKSTFINTLIAIFGDHHHTLDVSSLMQNQTGQSGINNDIAPLCGKRFITAQESEKGQRLKEGMIKQWTGRDKISARFLHQEFFDFSPTFKVWLSTNNRPSVSSDDAVWARLNLIPFTHQFTPQEIHEGLKKLGCAYEDYLIAHELPGILNWCIAGCVAWQRNRLGSAPEVDAANMAYRSDMDVVGSFLREFVNDAADLEHVTAREIYASYNRWCQEAGTHPLKQSNFEEEVKTYQIDGTSAGFTITTGHGSKRYWRGLDKLKAPAPATYTQETMMINVITPTPAASVSLLTCPQCHYGHQHAPTAIVNGIVAWVCQSCQCHFSDETTIVKPGFTTKGV